MVGWFGKESRRPGGMLYLISMLYPTQHALNSCGAILSSFRVSCMPVQMHFYSLLLFLVFPAPITPGTDHDSADEVTEAPVSKRLRSQTKCRRSPAGGQDPRPPIVLRLRTDSGKAHPTIICSGTSARRPSRAENSSQEPSAIQPRCLARNDSAARHLRRIERKSSIKEHEHQEKRFEHRFSDNDATREVPSAASQEAKSGSASRQRRYSERLSSQSKGTSPQPMKTSSLPNGSGPSSSANHVLSRPDNNCSNSSSISARTRTKSASQLQASSAGPSSAAAPVGHTGSLKVPRQQNGSAKLGRASRNHHSRSRSKSIPKRITATHNSPVHVNGMDRNSLDSHSCSPQSNAADISNRSADLTPSPSHQHQLAPPKVRLAVPRDSDEVTTFYTSLFSPDSMITRSKSKSSDVQAVHISPGKSKSRNSASPMKPRHLHELVQQQWANDKTAQYPGSIPELLSPNGMNVVDISIECRTRKSFSDLDISGGSGDHNSSKDASGSKQGEVLTSNNVIVALKGEGDCNDVFDACPVKMEGGTEGLMYNKLRMDRVMSITIETCHSEDGRRASEVTNGTVDDSSVGNPSR